MSNLLFNGKEISSYKEKLEFYRYDVGFVFQNFVLIENKTVRENLEMVNKKYRTSYNIKNVLEKVDLLDKIDSKVYTLSGGEQQRIALARLFFKKSSIILADEPTGSLDYGNAKKVMEIIKELNNEGRIVILVTHDEKTKQIADRIIEI
ncbi:ABC transporter ATP-binding protein [Clostridiaceae bacterium HSG29]|nr:ABC transporter ATP-binding protein [Clostridiaceae bacterium HSG29]